MQGLGYRGDIGYHTFLYSNDIELRRVLMFLVDRLPKDHSGSADQSVGNDDALVSHIYLFRCKICWVVNIAIQVSLLIVLAILYRFRVSPQVLSILFKASIACLRYRRYFFSQNKAILISDIY